MLFAPRTCFSTEQCGHRATQSARASIATYNVCLPQRFLPDAGAVPVLNPHVCATVVLLEERRHLAIPRRVKDDREEAAGGDDSEEPAMGLLLL